MDTNNWRSARRTPKAEPPSSMDVEGGDWRSQLQMESRQLIVSKIKETLNRYVTCSGQEGSHELGKIAVRFEEKIYTAATSQTDYLRKISVKMLSMETNSKNKKPVANSLSSNSYCNGENPPNPVQNSMNIGSGDWQSQLKFESRQNSMDIGSGDWRSQLQFECRQRMVKKTMDTLKMHLPFSSQEGLHELQKIAVKSEEKIYNAASSQSDYLRKVTRKMLCMGINSRNQNPMSNSLPSNSIGNGKNPLIQNDSVDDGLLSDNQIPAEERQAKLECSARYQKRKKGNPT